MSELATHAAVDEEVDRVAKNDARVDDERRRLLGVVVEYRQLERVLDDEQDEQDGEWELDEEEETDDDDQHERGDVAVGQSPTLVATHVDGQQVRATSLSAPHLTHQQRVEHDQRRTRHQVNDDDPTPEVGAKVDVSVCLEPLAPQRQTPDYQPRLVVIIRKIYTQQSTRIC